MAFREQSVSWPVATWCTPLFVVVLFWVFVAIGSAADSTDRLVWAGCAVACLATGAVMIGRGSTKARSAGVAMAAAAIVTLIALLIMEAT